MDDTKDLLNNEHFEKAGLLNMVERAKQPESVEDRIQSLAEEQINAMAEEQETKS